MRRWNVIPLVRLLACWLLIACLVDAALAADPPVRADYLMSRNGGKSRMKFHSVRLTLVNQQDEPVWFVLPYWVDKPLSKKGIFPNKNWNDQPFGGQQFEGEGGSAVEVLMYGGDGFRAFRLPAKGRLELDGYSLGASKHIREIVVLEARELRVNGKTPLETWLPYGTTSDEKVKVAWKALNIDWKNLDWDAKKLGKRDDYPKEKVETVKAVGFRSWTVKVQQGEKKAP